MTSASTTLVQTPNVAKMRDLLDRILEASNPMEFHFRTERYGSFAVAKSKAVSFRNQFHSIRARARNSRQVTIGIKNAEFTGEQIKGMYDDLFCDSHVLPNDEGYVIRIGRAQEDEFEIYDSVTKERIVLADPKEARFDYLAKLLLDKAFNPNIQPPYLSPEHEREFFELNSSLAREYYKDCGCKVPAWVNGMAELAANPPELDDLVNTPMDDFGVGPGEGE